MYAKARFCTFDCHQGGLEVDFGKHLVNICQQGGLVVGFGEHLVNICHQGGLQVAGLVH